MKPMKTFFLLTTFLFVASISAGEPRYDAGKKPVTSNLNALEHVKLPKCLGSAGDHLCKGLGTEDAAGNVQDLNWCAKNISSALALILTNKLFNSTQNTFSQRLDQPSIDRLFSIIGCIQDFVAQYTNHKDLTDEAADLVELITSLINTTQAIYNVAFSSGKPVEITTYFSELIGQLETISRKARAIEEKLTIVEDCVPSWWDRLNKGKSYFSCKNMVTVKDLLLTIATIVSTIAKKAYADVDKQVNVLGKSLRPIIKSTPYSLPELPPRSQALQGL